MSKSELRRIQSCLRENGEADVEFMSGTSWHIVYDDATRTAEIYEFGEYITEVSSMTELVDCIEEKEENE